MKILTITATLLYILLSCNNAHRPLADSSKEPISWQMLIIESRGQTISIDRHLKYGVRDTCDFQEVKVDEYLTEYEPINRGHQFFDISEQEKDSLFIYIYDIVTNPVYTEQCKTSA